MRINSLSVVLIACGPIGSIADACSIHGSNAADAIPNVVTSRRGVVESQLLLESSLVPPASATTCAAGVGLGTSDNPLPPGVDVTDLAIVVVHTDGSRTPLGVFSFEPNTSTSAALATGSGSDNGSQATNPLFDGSTWFGFSSTVTPFELPALGPNEFTAFEFIVEVPEALLPLTVEAQFAAGEAMADGAPIFSGDHPAQYFAAANRAVVFVPEPSEIALTALGMMWLLGRYR